MELEGKVIVYLDKNMSEEINVSTLYEDDIGCAVEISEEDLEVGRMIENNYYAWQEKLQELYEKSPRRDKR
jgi:hypothetical protein